jgi:uncharacterized protein (TIGR03435 family)
MRQILAVGLLLFAGNAAFAQSAASLPQFEAAQVRQSQPAAGRAWERITADPGRLTASGVPLKQLIFEAYDMPYYRIFGGPPWLESEYYDLEATAGSAVSREQLKLMLRSLLADRFKLAIHRETRELRAYALTVAKNGPKLRVAKDGESVPDQRAAGIVEHFHCDLVQFANLLSLRLTMPMTENQDPTVPVRATGVPPPVLDQTGIKGVFDISVELKPEPGADTFVIWQRALEEQLGLKLTAEKAPVEVLVIDHAERIPTAN